MRSACRVCLWAMLVGLLLPAVVSGGELPQRWAVLSSPELQKSALADLVTVELAQTPGMELVERDQINKALRELGLNQALGDTDVRTRLQLGRILKADVLVLMTVAAAAPPASQASAGSSSGSPSGSGPQTYLRLVIVDSRQGARLSLDLLPYESSQAEFLAKAALEAILRVKSRFASGLQKVVGLSHFVCRNFTHEYDQYQAGFAHLLSGALSSLPGTAVIETEEAQAVRHELELADGSGIERIMPVLVEGEYEVSKAEPDSQLQVKIGIQMTDGAGKKRTIDRDHLPMADVSRFLAAEAPGLLDLSKQAEAVPFTPQQQMAALVARADTFTRIGSYEDAAGLREAALLLQPDDVKQQLAAIHDHCRTLDQRLPRGVARKPGNPAYEAGCLRRLGYWRIAAAHMETLIARKQLNQRIAKEEVEFILYTLWSGNAIYGKSAAAPAFEQARRQFLLNVFPRVLDLPLEQADRKLTIAQTRNFQASAYGEWERVLFMHAPYAIGSGQMKVPEDLGFLLEVFRRVRPELGPPGVYGLYLAQQFAHLPKGDPSAFLTSLEQTEIPHIVYYAKLARLRYQHGRMPDTQEMLKAIDALVADIEAYCRKNRYNPNQSIWDNARDLQKEVRRKVQPAQSDAVAKVHKSPPFVSRMRFDPISWHVKVPSGQVVPAERLGEKEFYRPGEVLRCTDSLDVFYTGMDVYFMRTKGVLEPILTNEEFRILAIAWDGQYLWIATQKKGLWVVTAEGQCVARIQDTRNLPPANYPPIMCGLSPGKVFLLGCYGQNRRTWCSVAEWDGSKAAAHLVLATTRLGQADENKDEVARDINTIFETEWVVQCADPKDDSRQILLVSRHIRAPVYGEAPALQIDLQTLKPSLSSYVLPCNLSSAGGTVWRETSHEFLRWAGPGRTFEDGKEWKVVFRLPEDVYYSPPQSPRKPLVLGDSMYLLGNPWFRINLKNNQAEELMAGTRPRHINFMRHYGISAHYGLLGWNSEGEVYQVSADESAPLIPIDRPLYGTLQEQAAATQPTATGPAASQGSAAGR